MSPFAAAVEDLMVVDRRAGVALTLFNLLTLNSLLLATFLVPSGLPFFAMALVTGTYYASVMMTTHDAIHHTLSGIVWFDELMPRLFSYFIFWPHGLYSELHKIHHKLNGRDLHDPENPTATLAEYEKAGRFKRWRMRHHWWLALFVYGGFGMIYRHVGEGIRLYKTNQNIKLAMRIDAVGIAIAAALTVAVIIWTGVTWKYFVYLFIVERIIGFCQQLRSHIEHYGLWGERETVVEARLYNSRNIRTSKVISRFFHGLNYHSVHHAYPRIPYRSLPVAHARIGKICAEKGEPLPEGSGYVRTLLHLAHEPRFILIISRSA